jgi:hypothetical protein
VQFLTARRKEEGRDLDGLTRAEAARKIPDSISEKIDSD